MRKVLLTMVLLNLCWFAGCSPRDFLTRRLAADLIASSHVFTAPQSFVLRTGTIANRDFVSPQYLALQRHGWITGVSATCPPELAPPPCWNVSLTPLGVDTIRGIAGSSSRNAAANSATGNSPTGNVLSANEFNIPAARRELTGVTGISRHDNLAEVEFSWKWTALNEMGAALYPGGTQYSSTVGFKKFDDGWRLDAGDPARSYQSMVDALKNAGPPQ